MPKYPHIYAGGDITEITEEKTAQKAKKHAHVIVKNIIAQMKGAELKPYKTGVSPLVISLGDLYGISQIDSAVLAGFGHGLLKKIIEWWTLEQFY